MNYVNNVEPIGELQEAINNPIQVTNSSTYNGLVYTDDMIIDDEENKSKTNKKNRIGLK